MTGDTTRMMPIREPDLAELERLLPMLTDEIEFGNGRAGISALSPAGRTRVRRIQQILSDVRWNYGPHTEIEVIPAGDEP